eukprot:m.160788 g.160788  ORF g.160788 m.160788 type:complete len:291 (+) comp15174_c0_seq1:1-873(+)
MTAINENAEKEVSGLQSQCTELQSEIERLTAALAEKEAEIASATRDTVTPEEGVNDAENMQPMSSSKKRRFVIPKSPWSKRRAKRSHSLMENEGAAVSEDSGKLHKKIRKLQKQLEDQKAAFEASDEYLEKKVQEYEAVMDKMQKELEQKQTTQQENLHDSVQVKRSSSMQDDKDVESENAEQPVQSKKSRMIKMSVPRGTVRMKTRASKAKTDSPRKPLQDFNSQTPTSVQKKEVEKSNPISLKQPPQTPSLTLQNKFQGRMTRSRATKVSNKGRRMSNDEESPECTTQ